MTPKPKSDHSNKQTISMEFELQHPPEKVWRARTEPALLAEWLLPLVNRTLQLEPGKAFRFQAPPLPGWEGSVNCRFIEIERHRKLSYTWVVGGTVGGTGGDSSDDALDTVVTFTLTPTQSGTRLSLAHTGFQPNQMHNVAGARYGWTMMGEQLLDLLTRI